MTYEFKNSSFRSQKRETACLFRRTCDALSQFDLFQFFNKIPRIEESTSRIFGRVGRRNNFFFSPCIIPPYRGSRLTSFDRERSFDPLFGAVVTPFDRNHSIRYGRLNPAAALAPFHIPLSSVNLPTCFKPSLSPPAYPQTEKDRWIDG